MGIIACYCIESLSLTKNRLSLVKCNERMCANAKGIRNCNKITNYSSRNSSKPLVSPLEDQYSNCYLLWSASSLLTFDNMLKNDTCNSICLDDDLSLGGVLDKVFS